MQCPNCQKEAISVNGKFVCLDCGIEINPSGSTPTAPAATDSIVNHDAPQPTIIPGPVSPFDNSAQAAVADTVSQETPGAAEPLVGVPSVDPLPGQDSVQPSIIPEPLSPIGSPEPSASMGAEAQEVSAPIETPASPESQIATPIKDEFLKEIETSPAQELESQSLPASGGASVVPDFPIGTASVNEDPISQASWSDDSATTEPIEPTQVPFASEQTSIENNPASGTPSQDPVEPESYFQPNQINIAPVTNSDNAQNDTLEQAAAPMNDNSDAPVSTEPSTSVSEAPVSMETPGSFSAQPVSGPAQNQAASASPAGGSLDDLLDAYSAPNSEVSASLALGDSAQPSTNLAANPIDSVQPAVQDMPIDTEQTPPGQIPSYEQVFGSQSSEQAAQAQNYRSESLRDKIFNNKKLLIIIAAVVGLVVLGSITAVIVTGLSKKSPSATTQVDRAVLSQKIQNAMEGDINAEVQFDQSIDFTSVKFTDNFISDARNKKAIDSLATPAANKGTWKASKGGDLSLEATVNGNIDNKIYISSEKNTYELGADGITWAKKAGMNITTVPDFYPIDSRAKLFYVAQAENIVSLGKDEINGISYSRYRIVPKPEFIEAIIKKSIPAIKDLVFTSTNTDSLAINAWIDSEGKIAKISADGIVKINGKDISGEGTISIKSEASYGYNDTIQISKPTQAATKAFPDLVQVPQQIDKEIKTTVIKASTVTEETAGRG